MRFLYVYFMRDEPDRVGATAPRHAVYWRELALRDFVGGPFADRSGGLITFEAGTTAQAEELVAYDPFVREDLLAGYWVKEWIIN
jgi:uncharacterized protein YciI